MSTEPRSLLLEELKAQGHRTIESIQALGCGLNGKNGVYSRLSRKLHVPEPEAHFASMKTCAKVRDAIKALHQVREDIVYRNATRKLHEIDRDKDGFATHQKKTPQEPKPKVEKTLPNKTLSAAEQREAFAKLKVLNENKKKSWWKKLIHMLVFAR